LGVKLITPVPELYVIPFVEFTLIPVAIVGVIVVAGYQKMIRKNNI
jgi:hypothetical protein